MSMKKTAKALLESFGYQFQVNDDRLLDWAVKNTEGYARSCLNIKHIPEEYVNAAAELTAAAFLEAKKTFSPEDISTLELDAAVKRIEAGDTNIEFYSDSTLTDEQRFDRFTAWLKESAKAALKPLRRLRW